MREVQRTGHIVTTQVRLHQRSVEGHCSAVDDLNDLPLFLRTVCPRRSKPTTAVRNVHGLAMDGDDLAGCEAGRVGDSDEARRTSLAHRVDNVYRGCGTLSGHRCTVQVCLQIDQAVVLELKAPSLDEAHAAPHANFGCELAVRAH